MRATTLAAGTVLAMLCVLRAAAADESDYAFRDGNALLAVCGDFVTAMDRGGRLTERDILSTTACTAYLRGFSHGVALLSSEPAQGYGYCVEDTVPSRQIARVVVRYLKENPQVLHQHPAVLVAKALRQGFPCGRP